MGKHHFRSVRRLHEHDIFTVIEACRQDFARIGDAYLTGQAQSDRFLAINFFHLFGQVSGVLSFRGVTQVKNGAESRKFAVWLDSGFRRNDDQKHKGSPD